MESEHDPKRIMLEERLKYEQNKIAQSTDFYIYKYNLEFPAVLSHTITIH